MYVRQWPTIIRTKDPGGNKTIGKANAILQKRKMCLMANVDFFLCLFVWLLRVTFHTGILKCRLSRETDLNQRNEAQERPRTSV